MALRGEETEFLNRVDQVLSKNLNNMKDQFNAILDDSNIQTLLDTAKHMSTMQSELYYYQIFMFFMMTIAIWFCYNILSGQFVERLYTNISNQVIKKNEEVLKEQEKRFSKLETIYKIQFDLAKETNTLLHQQNLVSSNVLRSVSEFERKLQQLAQENIRLQAELSKTQNILRKKIKKGEKDAG